MEYLYLKLSVVYLLSSELYMKNWFCVLERFDSGSYFWLLVWLCSVVCCCMKVF